MRSKKILVAIILILGLFSILNISNSKKILPYTNSGNLEITINDNNVNMEVFNLYKNNLETLPESMKQYAKSITITSENLSDKFELNLNAKILGISCGNEIYINSNEFNDHVLIHELFHVFDYSHNWLSQTDEFLSIYEAEKNQVKVTDGNAQNVFEFWASAGELLYFTPDVLKEIAPLTYNYMAEHVTLTNN